MAKVTHSSHDTLPIGGEIIRGFTGADTTMHEVTIETDDGKTVTGRGDTEEEARKDALDQL